MNISHVDRHLYRGPRPSSMEALKAHGIKNIINLQSGFFEALYDDLYEIQFAEDFGMREYNFCLSDFSVPKKGRILKALSIIDRGELTYIHCKHGVDRTGYLVAAWRITRCGWSYEAAVKEMYKMGFHKFPYWWWVKSLKGYIAGA